MTGIRGQESGQEKELGLKAASTMGREDGRMEDRLLSLLVYSPFVFLSSSFYLSPFPCNYVFLEPFLPFPFPFLSEGHLVQGIRLTRTRLIKETWTKIP